ELHARAQPALPQFLPAPVEPLKEASSAGSDGSDEPFRVHWGACVHGIFHLKVLMRRRCLCQNDIVNVPSAWRLNPEMLHRTTRQDCSQGPAPRDEILVVITRSAGGRGAAEPRCCRGHFDASSVWWPSRGSTLAGRCLPLRATNALGIQEWPSGSPART